MAHADMFLLVKGQRTGAVKGESSDKAHPDQIEVLSWRWGVDSPTDAATGDPTGRRTYATLSVVKRVDRATPVLYQICANNETVTTATLTVRKAGGSPKDYFVLTLGKARVKSIDTRSGDPAHPDHPEHLYDEVEFAFRRVDMMYQQQQADGSLGGGITFSDDISDQDT